MEVVTLNAEKRESLGRHRLAQLRAAGYVPAVIYGGEGASTHVQIKESEIDQHLRHHHKVFNAEVDGKKESLLLHIVQHETTTDRVQHIDFLRIDLTKPVHLTVELTWLGHPVGLGKGGRLIHDISDLKITCLPTHIPESIEVNIADLDLGQSIHASDLKLGEGVQLDLPPDAVICHVVMPQAETAEAEPALEPVPDTGAPAAAEKKK